MLIENRMYSLFMRLAIIAFGLLGINLVIMSEKVSFPMEMFVFYTIQSNIITILISFVLLLKDIRLFTFHGEKGKPATISPIIQLGNVFIILVTFLVYATLLNDYTFSEGYEWEGIKFAFGNILLHYIVPLLTVADYMLFCAKGKVSFKKAILWLSYPFAYFIFIMIRAKVGEPLQNMGQEVTTYYPYPFLDVDVLGWNSVIINAIGLLIILLGIVWVLSWADGKLGKNGQNLEKSSEI
ncbi:MAG: Pr6Pr family membrane protein [Bacilli bacterium]